MPQAKANRIKAVKVADVINSIEGTRVTRFAKDLSEKWSKSEITREEMKNSLLAKHKKKSKE